MLETRSATVNDLSQIVSIHGSAFPGFFLTRLGPAFLHELYSGFLTDPDHTGTIILACEDEEILGFAAGTSAPETFFRNLRTRRWFFFLLKAIPGLLASPGLVFRKLWSAMRYRGDTAEELPGGALLSSLAVSPRAQKKGVGRVLVQRFCELSEQSRREYVYVITDKEENRAIIEFYARHGFVAHAVLTKQNKRQMVRLVKTLTDNSTAG